MPSTLTDGEIAFLKAELGYNVLDIGAVPYVGVTALFEQVIQTNVTGGASTTSTTAVTAATSPTPVTLTLASAADFATGDRVVIDVDSRQETATIQNLSGVSATLLLSLAHSGTYPIAVESPITFVRNAIAQIRRINGGGGLLQGAVAQSGIKKVDEVEFFGGHDGSGSRFQSIEAALTYWRDYLAKLIGVPNRSGMRSSGGGRVELY